MDTLDSSLASGADRNPGKNIPKVVNAWCSYDWSNSVYNLSITTAIFPIYYMGVTREAFGGDLVRFFGFEVSNTVLYSWAIAFSYLAVAALSPLLSGIADYSGNKKNFMRFFTYLGASACLALYFFDGPNVEYGIICSLLACIGYAGALVFYNAYLPEIATPDKFDEYSARGFSMGYIGSVLLLVVNLVFIKNPSLLGLETSGEAVKVAFLMVGVWWLGFSQIAFAFLPDSDKKSITREALSSGYGEIRKVWASLSGAPNLKLFLFSFFFYSMGVQTVMLMAPLFGEKELKIDSATLIGIVLILQLVAVAGAYLFAFVSKKAGNKTSIAVMLVMWIGICAGAYMTTTLGQFYVLAISVGTVMGGIQSLSRSTYSKLLPSGTHDTASYFSFYDVAEKTAIVLGMFSYGLIESITGGMRNSALSLAVFFVIGFFILLRLSIPKETAE